MSRTIPKLSPSTDPLGETLHLLRLTGTLYCRSELTAPWGVDLPPIEGCMMFHVVTADLCARHKLATADAIIYATALAHGADLLTCDRRFEGLDRVLYVAKSND
jgi:hypothetical protein